MNLSVRDIGGGLLLVPQFTLTADTRKGTRASFTRAAEPGRASSYFDALVENARMSLKTVEMVVEFARYRFTGEVFTAVAPAMTVGALLARTSLTLPLMPAP